MSLRREVGFWKALMSFRLGELLLAPETIAAAAIGGAGSIWLVRHTAQYERVGVASDYLFVVGPLVGVAVAGLALVITLLSGPYLRTLRGDKPLGIIPFLRPFMFAIGVQSATVVGSVVYRAASADWSDAFEQTAFCVLSFLFVLSTLEVVAIGRNLIAHGVTRSAEADVEQAENDKPVRVVR